MLNGVILGLSYEPSTFMITFMRTPTAGRKDEELNLTI